LDVSYLIGHISASVKKEDKQVLDRGTFDPQGNLLVGKDVSTQDLPQGNYRIVVKVSDPETHESTTQALGFQIISSDAFPMWTIVAPAYTQNVDSSTNSTRRGLCALAQQQPAIAVSYLKQAVMAGAQDKSIYRALATAYRLMGNSASAEEAEKQAGSAPASH
jgi:hypothetical protein